MMYKEKWSAIVKSKYRYQCQGLVPPWVAMIGMFLSLTVMICYVIRGTPEEKPDETPQKPPEITGAFDKFQFNKRK